MAAKQDDMTDLSLIVSRVLDDVGVNDENVMRYRRTNLVAENIYTLHDKICQKNHTGYIFGSQTEGTTTEGLKSDTDVLSVNERFNVMQEWGEWKPGKTNLLMIRDETNFPGYCKLLASRDDVPQPLIKVLRSEHRVFENYEGMTLILKHGSLRVGLGKRQGPAATFRNVAAGEIDRVSAMRCLSWPKHYKQWDLHDPYRDWPTADMVRHVQTTGCFVVAVAHRLDNKQVTWRISTSLAERCFMFSLNITQIRCYILLKMIVKTFITPEFPDTISSYMCKTLLFHCIEKSREGFWSEHNLLQCMNQLILNMITAVLDENCPNYFNESANLFIGKVDSRNKAGLLSKLRAVHGSQGKFVLEIFFDDISSRITRYLSDRNLMFTYEDTESTRNKICRKLIYVIYNTLGHCLVHYLSENRITQTQMNNVMALVEDFKRKCITHTRATTLLLPFICSHVATVKASKALAQGEMPSPGVLELFELSLNSDITSSNLKFASYLYCTGQTDRALSLLEDVERRMTDSMLMTSPFYFLHDDNFPNGFGVHERKQKYPTTDSLAFCVMFSQAEINCCPREIQHEMMKSVQEQASVAESTGNLAGIVVVDALPYVYFLQYAAFRQFGLHDQKNMALEKFKEVVYTNERLAHRDVAFSVLGQCMEYEENSDVASDCYRMSSKGPPEIFTVMKHTIRTAQNSQNKQDRLHTQKSSHYIQERSSCNSKTIRKYYPILIMIVIIIVLTIIIIAVKV